MIIVQHILLQWHKDCRGGKGAVQRSRYPLAAKLRERLNLRMQRDEEKERARR